MRQESARHWAGVDAQRRRAGWVDPDTLFARQQVAPLPESWAGALLRKWGESRRIDPTQANLAHLRHCRAIGRAMRAGVPANADDAAICDRARASANDAARRLDRVATIASGLPEPLRFWVRPSAHRERMAMLAQVLEALGWLDDLAADFLRQCRVGIRGALQRLRDEKWWRRKLRTIHARAVEATARRIGLVHKRAGCYVSSDSLKRRRGQLARNERALESVRAVNEHGQDYTLAELAAKGPANREIRRHELMTRIAGFELIAKECNHDAYFVTLTCPSSMHAFRTRRAGFGVEPNPSHDGTTPEEAQRHLTKQWGKFRAAADRAGLELYGFRIAEPNHDGTPHWHCVLFFPKLAVPPRGDATTSRRCGTGARGSAGEAAQPARRVRARCGRTRLGYRVAVRLLRRYFFWQASPDERGARHHRIEVKRIDWARGSATGYVAKYVAKNIDGYKVEKDLYGNDAITSSQRVEAWAATWRIRQFQQVGGAPVGVWRELRRLHPEQEGAAPAIGFALEAVNLGAKVPADASEAVDRYTAATGWAAYLHLQGGFRVRRASLRVGLLRESTGEVGRYGEVMAPRPVGVRTLDARAGRVVEGLGIVPVLRLAPRRVEVEVESERSTWLVVPAGFVEQARQRMHEAPAGGAAARPWSPVNNCTRPDQHPVALFGRSVERTRKRGRWHAWKSPNGGVRTEENHHDPDRRHPDPDRDD